MTIPLCAFVLTLLILVGIMRFFPQWGLLDFPMRYGLRRSALPYPGGIAAVIAFLIIFWLLQAIDARSIGVITAVAIIGIMSFIDDRRSLNPLLRLVIQIAVGLGIYFTGDCTGGQICSITNPLEGIVGGPVLDFNGTFPWIGLVITVAWIFVTINALNWFDGIPGQTTTLSTIGFATIGLLSLSDRVNQPQIALLAFSLSGIAFACLLFDFPPPRMVLGDSGSMFFGLMLGILTIYSGGKVATAFLVLGVPIIDFIFVIFKRLWEGRPPYKGSMHGEHLHHRLLAKGWSSRSIILLTASIGAAFGITALFLDTFGKFVAGAILGFIMLILWFYSSPRIRQP